MQSMQGQHRWEGAISACQQGMACAGTTKDFEPLRNTLAVQAAQRGCFAGFPGRLLDVSSRMRTLPECACVL